MLFRLVTGYRRLFKRRIAGADRDGLSLDLQAPTLIVPRASGSTGCLEDREMRALRFFWRIIQNGPRLAYALGLGPLVGRFVLLVTTRGRKTGLPRTNPLVYE